MYWKLFGSSGIIERNEKNLVTEDFIISWPKYKDLGKIFYNTAYDFDINYEQNKTLHHYAWGKYRGISLPPVNIFNKICHYARNDVPGLYKNKPFPVQLNHYITKSYEEYKQKQSKGDVFYTINPHDEEYLLSHEIKNQSCDYSVYKYLLQLKLAIKEQ